jgi:hypothetical protein
MKEQPGASRTQFVPVGAATLWTQTSGQGRPLVLALRRFINALAMG